MGNILTAFSEISHRAHDDDADKQLPLVPLVAAFQTNSLMTIKNSCPLGKLLLSLMINKWWLPGSVGQDV